MLKSICIALHLCSSIAGPARIIDGDTIVVEAIHVRLFGLDAEELNEPHGLEAKAYMQMLVREQIITCKLTGDKSYDRYIGTCFANGADLAVAMVNAGKALDCAHYSKGKYRQYEPVNIRLKLIQKPYC